MRFFNGMFATWIGLGFWSAVVLLLSRHGAEAGTTLVYTALGFLTWAALGVVSGQTLRKEDLGWMSFGSLVLALLAHGVPRALAQDFVGPLVTDAAAANCVALCRLVFAGLVIVLLVTVFKKEGFRLPINGHRPTAQQQTSP